MRGKERVATALMVGMFAFSGCKPADVGRQTPLPNAPKIEQSSPVEQAWRNLSSSERINRIELEKLPSFPTFNASAEFIRATSEFYCEQIPCDVNAKDLESKVLLLDIATFNKEVEKTGLQPSVNIPEIVPDLIFSQSRADRKILVNTDTLKTYVDLLKGKVPNIENLIKNHSLYYVFLRQLLFHTYSHANQSTEKIQSKDIPFLSFPDPDFKLKAISNLAVVSVNQQDGNEYEFARTMEAMTEYVGIVVGNYFDTPISASRLKDSAEILAQVNAKAGISFSEFLQYYKGEKPFLQFIGKLGSIKNGQPNMQSGFRIYFLIGNAADNDPQKVISLIEKEIGQKLSS